MRVWLDEWELRPGDVWLEKIDEIIHDVGTAAIMVGAEGMGGFQRLEINALTRLFNAGRRVIPVLLREAADQPTWPVFADDFHRVDFRKTEPDPMKQLIWGITGKKPK